MRPEGATPTGAERGSPGAAAVILAAGASQRFFGQPKALLPVGSETAIERVTRLAGASGFAPVIVVAGPHIREIEAALHDRSVELVENPDWHLGRTGSVQVGLRAAGDGVPVLLWPVDHPFVDRSSVDTLLRVGREDPLALWLIPTFQGHGGHPVLIRDRALRRIGELEPFAPLRFLLPGLGPEVRRVPVRDPGVAENIDTPDAYRDSLEAWRAREAES